MQMFSRGLVRNCALAACLLVLPATLLCSAEQSAPKPTDVPAIVIAHLVLPQPTGSQMLLQREEGKQYLYVQQASKQGFMIVDVSKPQQPSLLKRTAQENQSTAGNLQMVTPDVAIAEAPEKTPTTLTNSNRPTETVRLLDLSDPQNPKTLETLAHEISAVAVGVPVPTLPAAGAIPDAEKEPTPRPVQGKVKPSGDAWDFLKPVSRLKPSSESEKSTAATTTG